MKTHQSLWLLTDSELQHNKDMLCCLRDSSLFTAHGKCLGGKTKLVLSTEQEARLLNRLCLPSLTWSQLLAHLKLWKCFQYTFFCISLSLVLHLVLSWVALNYCNFVLWSLINTYKTPFFHSFILLNWRWWLQQLQMKLMQDKKITHYTDD